MEQLTRTTSEPALARAGPKAHVVAHKELPTARSGSPGRNAL